MDKTLKVLEQALTRLAITNKEIDESNRHLTISRGDKLIFCCDCIRRAAIYDLRYGSQEEFAANQALRNAFESLYGHTPPKYGSWFPNTVSEHSQKIRKGLFETAIANEKKKNEKELIEIYITQEESTVLRLFKNENDRPMLSFKTINPSWYLDMLRALPETDIVLNLIRKFENEMRKPFTN